MRSWAAPEPRPPRHSRYLWIALLGWCGALYLGYRLVWPNGWANSSNETYPLEPTVPDENFVARSSALAPPLPSPEVAQPPERMTEAPTKKTEPSAGLPGCESFLGEARNGDGERMPTQMGRSAIAAFIEDNAWLKPCRRKNRRTLRFCAAIQDGTLVGLSLRAEPHDITLEACVREQALKVSLRTEPSLRIVDTRLTL